MSRLLGLFAALAVGCTTAPIPPPPSLAPTGAPTTSPTASASEPLDTPIPSPSPAPRVVGPLELEQCDQLGYIPCEHQAVRLRVPIAGTGVALTYSSEWAPGRLDRPSEWNAESLGLGGWTLNVLQRYDAANGVLLSGDGSWRFAGALAVPNGESAVPSFGGRLAYVFDTAGRHVRTLDAILGVDLLRFTYDDKGRLLSAQGSLDSSPIRLAIERSADGALSGLTGAGGAFTRIDTDGAGHLGSITHPDGGRDGFFATAQGLVTAHLDPGGGMARFVYDEVGRLSTATDPDGVGFAYERLSSTTEVEITVARSAGGMASYRSRIVDTAIERVYVAPRGPTTTLVESADGQRTLALPDGTSLTIGSLSDRRWGLAAPILSPIVQQRPDGVLTRAEIELALETASDDPLRLTAWTRATTVNGDRYTERYDSQLRALTLIDPMGRESTRVYDEQGRLVSRSVPGMPLAAFEYDDDGRLVSEARGSGAEPATTTYAYEDNGRVVVTRPDGATEYLLVDPAGRVVRHTAADGSSVLLSYDVAGRPILVRLGGEQSTTLGYSPAGRPSAFVPPPVAGDSSYEVIDYDDAGRMASVSGPGDRAIALDYDDVGRLIGVRFDRGQLDAEHDPATGRPTTIAAPGGVTTTYSYVGELRSGVEWAGPVSGSVRLEFDALRRPSAELVNSGPPVRSTYDRAGRLTAVGSVAIDRDAQSGLATAASLGVADVAWQYDADGRLTSATATANGALVIGLAYERDVFGRISRQTEVSPDGQRVTQYRYDGAGRLVEVALDGTTVEESEYDGSGNRVLVTLDGPVVTADYDARNQLRQWATVSYEYEPDGTLARRVDGEAVTIYDFDDLGALRAVVLPDGRHIEYLVDWSGRPIGRLVDGELVAGYLYRPDGRLVAELDGDGRIVSRFAYDDRGRLVSMVRDGASFLVATDHLGGPRLVIDSSSGEIAQAIEYDAWGHVLSDSNPGFQPFGFAGGLQDPDTGLVHFGAREFDPGTGRWIESDPLRIASDDANLYAYANGDPVNRSDPSGLDDDVIIEQTEEGWTGCHLPSGVCVPVEGPPQPPAAEAPPDPSPWEPPKSDPNIHEIDEPDYYEPPYPGYGDWCETLCPTLGDDPDEVPWDKEPPDPCTPPDCTPAPPPCIGICPKPGGGICVGICSSGDPHLRTADHVSVSFQGAGEFLMLASEDNTVVLQARQQAPGDLTAVTITTAIAAAVGGRRVGVYLKEDLSLRVDGEAVVGDTVLLALPGGGSLGRQGSIITIEWPDGSRLTVERRGTHLDYDFVPDPVIARTLTGLMGTPDGDVTNDLVSRDRSLTLNPADPDFFARLHGPYADSWRISQEESLFDYGPGESTATFTRLEIPSAPALPASLDPDTRAAAEELCRAAGIRREPTLGDCIVDVGFTGDPSYAQSAAAVEAATAGAPPVPGIAHPIAMGDAVAGAILAADQIDRYTFAGSVGQVVSLDALGPCVGALSWDLRGPAGDHIVSGLICNDLGPWTIRTDGTYAVEVYSREGATGVYGFQLLAGA